MAARDFCQRAGAPVSRMIIVWETPNVRAMSLKASLASRRALASRC
jgi:hypothetical protein